MTRAAPLLLAAALAALAAPAPAHAAGLPLGRSDLRETRSRMALAPGVTWTRIVRGSRATRPGPWRAEVLEIDRRALRGRLAARLSNGRVPGRERTTALARRLGALAGVNGSYFGTRFPSVGDPVGVVGVDGRLVSEPVGGRSALLVPSDTSRRARVARLRFDGSVRLGSRSRLLDGVDRPRGLIPGCGGRGGDRPTQRASVVLTCTDPSELVLYSPASGSRTRTDARGVEATVSAGAVTRVRRGGNSRIPRDGYVLSGSGDAARFLLASARRGVRPGVGLDVRSGRQRFDPAEHAGIVGAGPGLVTGGRVRLTAAAEGVPRSFHAVRDPRTLAGVHANGVVLLVTVDGRRPGYSAGVTLTEAARTMRSLGAREALNLDGGGSTAMAIRGRLVNRPSDPGGERAVSNGLFVLP